MAGTMEQGTRNEINRRIRDSAQEATTVGDLSMSALERFLRTGEETWDGAGSGRFNLAQDQVYSRAAKTALRTLFHGLCDLLPPDAQLVPPVAQETIRQRVEPMVQGLVQRDWQ